MSYHAEQREDVVAAFPLAIVARYGSVLNSESCASLEKLLNGKSIVGGKSSPFRNKETPGSLC